MSRHVCEQFQGTSFCNLRLMIRHETLVGAFITGLSLKLSYVTTKNVLRRPHQDHDPFFILQNDKKKTNRTSYKKTNVKTRHLTFSPSLQNQ